MKTKLLDVFDEIYFKGLRNRHTGYATVKLVNLLQHLYDTYGLKTTTDLEENDRRIREPFDGTKPIESLYDQIEEAVEYVDAGNAPYHTSQIVARTYLLIFNTGLYGEVCK